MHSKRYGQFISSIGTLLLITKLSEMTLKGMGTSLENVYLYFELTQAEFIPIETLFV